MVFALQPSEAQIDLGQFERLARRQKCLAPRSRCLRHVDGCCDLLASGDTIN